MLPTLRVGITYEQHPGEIKSAKENINHGFNLMLFTFEKCILPIFKTDENG